MPLLNPLHPDFIRQLHRRAQTLELPKVWRLLDDAVAHDAGEARTHGVNELIAMVWGRSAIFAALLAAILPALRASGLDPVQVLKSAGPKSSAGRGERGLLRAVTTVQTAMTLALLVGAGLLIRTMMNLAKVPSGYDSGRVLTMSVTAVQGDRIEFHHRALERVSSLAGVQHAAFAWGVPLTGNSWPGTIEIDVEYYVEDVVGSPA